MMPKWFEDEYGIPYFKWPLPLGYNLFHVAGTQAGHAVAGASTPLEAAGEIASVFSDSFNPLGSGGTILNFFAPTLLDPMADIVGNTDFFGENIVPKQFDETTPYAERYKPNVNPGAKLITDTLSKATGGSSERKGAIDWSPEWIEHLWDFGTGGVGRLVSRGMSLTDTLLKDGDIDVNKVPFARVFTGQSAKFNDSDTYFKIREAVEVTEKEIEARFKEGDRAEVLRLRKKYAREVQMIPMMDQVEKRMAKLRKEYKAISKMQQIGTETRKKRLEALSKAMDEAQFIVRKKWNELGQTSAQNGAK